MIDVDLPLRQPFGLSLAILFSISLLLGCTVPLEDEEGGAENHSPVASSPTKSKVVPPSAEEATAAPSILAPPVITAQAQAAQKDFTFGYWLNGWRKQADDASADILCMETGHYGFSLDLANFKDARFGLLKDDLDYGQALAADATRLEGLSSARFNLEVNVGGQVYKAVSCKAGNTTGLKHLQSARLWESGRVVQHFDLLELIFENDAGERLGAHGKLDITAWPKGLTFHAEVTPGVIYTDGPHPGVNGNGLCVVEKPFKIPHAETLDHEIFSLEAWVKIPRDFIENTKGILVGKNGDSSSKGFFGFKVDEGEVSAVMNVVGGRQNAIGIKGGGFYQGEWNHLALVYDGKAMVFYINGEPRGRRNIATPRSIAKGAMFVGGGPHGHSSVARGVYDQVLIWDRPLSAAEVKKHAYNAKKMEERKGLVFTEFFKSMERVSDTEAVWKDARLGFSLRSDQGEWVEEQALVAEWKDGDTKTITLNCDLREEAMPASDLGLVVEATHGPRVEATFDESKNCYVAQVDDLKRPWKTGYTDIRNYDEFKITVNNVSGQDQKVPLLIDLRDVANITGLVPILCDVQGEPTGIPVQLSKNWHYQPWGAYLRSYMLLPAGAGETTYTLRIAYGFYGNLPSASHAQLSLVGYGGNGRWEQLGIGCWGETMCFDMDMSCVDVAITDVRLLMAREGLDGKKWNWTDAGWGGDWLNATEQLGGKLYPKELKTAYLAHGPCLTEVKYDGKYGPQRAIDMTATVRTLRTDDYARTFQTLYYKANGEANLENGWLFKVGRTGSAITPRIAYGNREGLLEERTVALTHKKGDAVVDQLTLEGEGPWWVSFPGAKSTRGKQGRPVGTRALIIRSYEATFNGVVYKQPTITMPVHTLQKDGEPNLDILLVPPSGVSQFSAGDEVKMDIEWMTLPGVADDYYGPNEAFRKSLTLHPQSWKPVYREVKGNALSVKVRGGELQNEYPVIVQVTAEEVQVDIQGGVGAVPLRFEGLHAATGYSLYQKKAGELVKVDQSVHGNDFWQTDYDAASNTWKRTYNLPLDGLAKSTWVLRRNAQ